MKVEHTVTRREFLAVTATAIAAGLLNPSVLAHAEESGDLVELGRVLFDYSFEWNPDRNILPPQTREEYFGLLNIKMGETVKLEPFDEDRPFRTSSIYPCCKLTVNKDSSWHGLLYDKLNFDMRALKLLEMGHPIYAHVGARDVMDIGGWPNSLQLVTLALDVFTLLSD